MAGRLALGSPTTYTDGAIVYCPGTDTGRRHAARGDRRAEPRPCRLVWGRVGPATTVTVSVKHGAWLGGTIAPDRQTLLLECSRCHERIEFVTSAAAMPQPDRAA